MLATWMLGWLADSQATQANAYLVAAQPEPDIFIIQRQRVHARARTRPIYYMYT